MSDKIKQQDGKPSGSVPCSAGYWVAGPANRKFDNDQPYPIDDGDVILGIVEASSGLVSFWATVYMDDDYAYLADDDGDDVGWYPCQLIWIAKIIMPNAKFNRRPK